MNAKVKVARLSIISNTCLIILKLIVGIFTGSVSIISEAIHSTMDLVASFIAYFSVKLSDKPADEDHPYGHGKVENISGVIEALLIFIASMWIIFEATQKILHPQEVESIGLGFVIMFVAAAVNFIVSKKIYKVAKEVDSIALEADALHLKADVYTSLGVGIGLSLIWITKLNFLDPIVAVIVAIFILKEAVELLKEAFNPLLDIKLSDEEINIIKEEISLHDSLYCNFHNLRTRRAGNSKYIDLHLVVPENMSVKMAHKICDDIESSIEKKIQNSDVLIHLECCDEICSNCSNICTDSYKSNYIS